MFKQNVFFSIFFFFFSFFSLLAQIYHKIEKGDTFYNLGEKYGISADYIKEANSEVDQVSLKIGEILIIPSKDKNYQKIKQAIQEYTVKPKDTLYFLSQKYRISIEKLKEINPQLQKNQLLEGMTLNIPESLEATQKNLEEKKPSFNFPNLEKAQKDEFITYVVEKDDDVRKILKKYNISFDTLLIYNPFLEKGLERGRKLKIPSKIHLSSEVLPTKDGINILLMLPLFLDVKTSKPVEKKIALEATSFYLGIVHAIKEVRKSKNVYVKVFDTKNDKNRIDQFLNAYNFSFIHAIIGPLFRSSIEPIAKHLKNEKLAIVSPLSASDLLNHYPNIIQAEIKDNHLIDPIVEEIKKSSHSASKIYLLGSSWKEESLDYFKSKFSSSQKEIFFIKEISDFPPEEKNSFFAIFFSEEEQSGKLFLELIEKSPKEQIVPLAIGYNEIYSKNKEKLKKYNFVFSAKNYFNTEIESSEQKKSILELKAIDCESQKHKYLGYDLTYDLLNRLSIEKDLLNKFPDFIYKGIISKYDYKRIDFDKAYVNKGVWIIRFVGK